MLKFICSLIVTVVVAWFVSVHCDMSHAIAFIIPSTTFPVTYLMVGFFVFFFGLNHMLRSK